MGGDDLKKVSAGQPIRVNAATWNAFIDAAQDYRQRTQNIGSASAASAWKPGVIFVRNDTGADRDQFAVVGLGSIVIGPSDNLREFKTHTVLSAVTPNINLHKGKFAILQQPIKSGKIGMACVDCISIAQVNITSTAHQTAEIADATTANLVSSDSGSAMILWAETGTGVKWAVVRFGPIPPPSGLIRVYNSAGTTCPRGGGGVLTVDSFMGTNSITQSTVDRAVNFVIATADIPSGSYGYAYVPSQVGLCAILTDSLYYGSGMRLSLAKNAWYFTSDPDNGIWLLCSSSLVYTTNYWALWSPPTKPLMYRATADADANNHVLCQSMDENGNLSGVNITANQLPGTSPKNGDFGQVIRGFFYPQGTPVVNLYQVTGSPSGGTITAAKVSSTGVLGNNETFDDTLW